jgi:RNA polymerase nonessential primary-like sigma factor
MAKAYPLTADTEEYIGRILKMKSMTAEAHLLEGETEGYFKDPTDIYLKEIGIVPLLNKEQEIRYARLVKQGDEKARKCMIESNLRLVVRIARRYMRSGMAILDLIEEGNIGLMRAVEKYDPERGFRFSTYSAWWIQQTIERAIMNQTRTIRLPVHMMKKINGYLRTTRNLSKNLDHEPSVDEIATAWGRTAEEVEKLISLNERVVSIDSPVSDEVDKPLLDTLGDSCQDPLEFLNRDKLKRNIELWLSKLTSKQRAVVEYRFGLNELDSMTLDETGQAIGLTRERVRQLQAEALKILKIQIEDQGNNFQSLLFNH